MNGVELCSGSIRINVPEIQEKVFKAINLPQEEAERKFGFLLTAFKYGAPPHAGIALGFDRLVALMVGAESLRDVIAFPKTQRATCAVTDAPSPVDRDQLSDLGLSLLYP